MNNIVKIEEVIKAIEHSDLDPVIKDILIRDIRSFGINDFIKEQLSAYCDKAAALIEERLAKNN
jgi:hypothetical protein